MLILLAYGCAAVPFGTWLFERTLTTATGDECATTLSHNYVGAYEPAEATEDTAWSTESETVSSNEVFFGRIEGTEDGGAVLIIGSEALLGSSEGGAWSFGWDASESSTEADVHAAGYQYTASVEAVATTRIAGSFDTSTFTGTWDEESESTAKYTESDTWGDDAAAYVGTTGQTPVSSYLLVTDAYGTETSAYNNYSSYECDTGGCALTVQYVCGYSYTMTGVLTDLLPEDNRWAEDAGQPAGIP